MGDRFSLSVQYIENGALGPIARILVRIYHAIPGKIAGVVEALARGGRGCDRAVVFVSTGAASALASALEHAVPADALQLFGDLFSDLLQTGMLLPDLREVDVRYVAKEILRRLVAHAAERDVAG